MQKNSRGKKKYYSNNKADRHPGVVGILAIKWKLKAIFIKDRVKENSTMPAPCYSAFRQRRRGSGCTFPSCDSTTAMQVLLLQRGSKQQHQISSFRMALLCREHVLISSTTPTNTNVIIPTHQLFTDHMSSEVWGRDRKVSEAWCRERTEWSIIRWKFYVFLDFFTYLQTTLFLKITSFLLSRFGTTDENKAVSQERPKAPN